MDPFQTILCPVDFSVISAHALRFAGTIAGGTKARTIAAYANWFEAPPYFTAGRIAAMKEEIEQSSQFARESLGSFVQKTLGERRVAMELRVVDALPVDGILRLIGETGADLVAMGTHGRSGIQKWMLGSVAERVIRESPVPVLTVRDAPPETLRNVLCPVDDTEVSRRALAMASALSSCFGAGLTVMHVQEAATPHPVADLCAWIPQAERARCSIREISRTGEAAEEILRVAGKEPPDLLVMGAPRRRFFEGMVLGATTVRTVRHAPCPVLTVPAEF